MRTSIYKDYPVGHPDPNRVLDYGELFIELPEKNSDNIRIKYGDGKTKYKDLPYRLGDTSTDELYFKESDEATINNALSKVVNGTDVRTAIANLKRAIELTAISSGIVPNISKENVTIKTDNKFTNVSDALESLTKTEPLEVTLGNMTQAITLVMKSSASGLDVSVQKVNVVPDYSTSVEEALDKVHSDEELGVIVGALKNAISLIEESGVGNVSNAKISYDESNAKTVSEALEEASNGSSLNEIVAGLKKAVKLVQIGGGNALDVTGSSIYPEESDATTKEEALNDADKSKKLGDVIAAIKKAIALTDSISDYGEETAVLAAKRLSAALNKINDNLISYVPAPVTTTKSSDNAIDEKVDINKKQVFYNESSAKSQQAALKEVQSGESLSSIIAGLKKAIELMDKEINISNLTVNYVDDESTSVESVAQNARAGQQLKDIIASLKNAILLLNKKVENQKYVSFIEDSDAKTATEYANKIVTGTELSDIVVNLKKAIILLDNKAVTPPNFNNYPLQIVKTKFSSATTAANSISNGSGIGEAVSALKQAVILLDDQKDSSKNAISNRIVYFDEDRSTTRDMALKSVLSGKSVSDNIAALKRAIELTDTNDEISNKSVKIVDDDSATIDEALNKIKSGNTLNADIAELKRAIELINSSDRDIDISTQKVEWNLTTTGTTLDALACIDSGRELNIIIPYIKKVLIDAVSDIKMIQKRQTQLEKQIESINAKLK